MNPHKRGWVGSVLKQQSVVTKNMINSSKNNLLNAYMMKILCKK